MTETEIRPALTVEEWENLPALCERLMKLAGYLGRDPAWMMAIYNAALPDNDPNKITQRDVNALVDHADYVLDHGWDVESRIMKGIAAKIAALLPPE